MAVIASPGAMEEDDTGSSNNARHPLVAMDLAGRMGMVTNGDMTIDLPLDANGSTKKMSPHKSVTTSINRFFPWWNGCIMQAILGTILQWCDVWQTNMPRA